MKNYYILLIPLLFSFTIHAQIIDIPDANFKNALVNTDCVDTDDDGDADSDADTNNDGELSVAEAEAINNLWVVNKSISSLVGIEYFINLIELECQVNQLTTLDVSLLSNLTLLKCRSNQLTTINVNGLSNIIELDCRNNQLSELNINTLSNLESFRCSNNQLAELELSTFTNLRRLDCENNQLAELDINALTNLDHVDCAGNQLTELNINTLNNLEYVDCADNQLTELDISALSNLYNLSCGNNQLTSLDFNAGLDLNSLSCGNNQIENLNIVNFENLQYLVCSNNQLTELDISGNPIIYSLIVNNNELTSIDLSNQEVALDHFDASNNNLTFLNFKNGIDDSEYFFTFDLNGVILFENNPNLNFICADVFELNAIQLVAEASGIMNFSLNSYCSFEPGGDFYTVEGNTRIDFDSNGCDIDDGVASNLNFSITNGAETGNFISNDSGFYSIPVQAGIHTITPNLENLNYFDVTPSSIAVDFPTDTSPFMQDFCITPNGTFNDLEITIIPLQAARPGFDTDYKLIYKNKGTTTLSGSVDLSFEDDLMDFVSVSPTEDAQAANMLIWNFTDLNPFESRVILFTMNINSPMDTPPVNGDEVLAFGATINSSETDETPDDNTSTLNQTVVNSFDPNDKTCLEGDVITPEMVGDYVHYMIRFENTGTASAVNIVVKDDIDRTKYDLSSLIAIDASHDFVARIKDDGSDYFVEFIFENINLPFDDANNDGYIVFKIKTLDTLVLGDTFENNAEIYFDFNFPIITNFAETSIATLSTEEFELANNVISLYPNPTTHSLYIESKQTIQHITMYDISGRRIKEIAVVGTKTELTMSTEALSTGTYFVKIKTTQGQTVRKVIKD